LIINNPNWLRVLLVLFILAMIIGLGIANYRFILQAPGGNDFLARWVGAHYWVVKGINPYDPQVSLAAQEMIYGRPANPTEGEDIAHFVYPLPAMIFFAPFGLLTYPIARTLWMTLLEISLPLLALIGVQLARWKPSNKLLGFLMVFSVVWYHGFRSVVVGQFAVIEALLMAGALLAIQRRMDSVAGILLTLSIAKPQMSFLLIPFILLWAARSRRWELISWTIGSMVVLVGISLALISNWPLLWVRQLLEYPKYTELGPPISILAGLVPSASKGITYGLTALTLLYLVWEWVLAMGKEDRWFQWTAALTIVITNLVAFRTATTNYVVLLPVLCMVFGIWYGRWSRRGAIFIWLALFVMLIGLWGLFLSTVEGNTESAIMYLPLPFVSLLGLLWSRWWTVSVPRFPPKLWK